MVLFVLFTQVYLNLTKDLCLKPEVYRGVVPMTLLIKRGIKPNYKMREGKTERQGDRGPVGGNLSSCSGYAWPAKQSCHLNVSFCTNVFCGPAASMRREEEGGREGRGREG